MRPELFRLFDVGFPSYFVLLLSGFLFATALGVLWARRIGLNPDVIVDLGLAMLLAGRRGLAPPPRLRGRVLLGLRAPLHGSRRRSTGRSIARSACRQAYEGVVGRGEGRVPSAEQPTASRGRSSGRAASRITAASSARPRPRCSCSAAIAFRSGRPPTWRASRSRWASRSAAWDASSRAAASARRRSFRGGSRSRRAARRARSRPRLTSSRAFACGANPCIRRRSTSRPPSLAIAAFCLLLGAAAQALRRAGLRRVARALRGRALPRRDPAARRARRRARASRRRSSSASACSWRRRSSIVHARVRAPRAPQ